MMMLSVALDLITFVCKQTHTSESDRGFLFHFNFEEKMTRLFLLQLLNNSDIMNKHREVMLSML